MKRVLLITNIPSPYRVDLFYYLQTNISKYQFHVMYCAKDANNRCWNIEQKKIINSHFLDSTTIMKKNKYDTNHVYIPKNLWKKLSEIRPDIIIGWEYNPSAITALLWCKLHKKKYISLTDGTLYSERNINYIQKINRKIVSTNCDAALASSTKAKEKLLAWGIPPEKIFVSLLTVDTENFIKVKPEPQVGRILYVGSMVKRKGLDLLISALRYVSCDYSLHIVGNGTDEEIDEMKMRAKNANVINSICFCGFKQGEELIEEYKKAQLFVLPTREDCFGLVLLEAFCMGVPIISSKYADGAYDIVEDGENGILVDPYDAKEFGAIIEKTILGKSFQKEKNKVNTIDKFAFDKVAQGYIDAIEYVAGNSK